jgi:hypothetical protein
MGCIGRWWVADNAGHAAHIRIKLPPLPETNTLGVQLPSCDNIDHSLTTIPAKAAAGSVKPPHFPARTPLAQTLWENWEC